MRYLNPFHIGLLAQSIKCHTIIKVLHIRFKLKFGLKNNCYNNIQNNAILLYNRISYVVY